MVITWNAMFSVDSFGTQKGGDLNALSEEQKLAS